MSIKHYCDHCGKELNRLELYELDGSDFINATWENSKRFYGYELCENCYCERSDKHIKLDLDFFGVKEEANNETD